MDIQYSMRGERSMERRKRDSGEGESCKVVSTTRRSAERKSQGKERKETRQRDKR